MVKQFKGQTKVADVQEAFDDIVTKINNLVTSYNAQSFVEEIDYTVGGTTLAPSGYTLTVGGYKQFLKACEGVVTGCKPVKINDNQFKVTTGMLVARNGIFRLPDSILDIPTDTTYRKLYYNPYTLAYQWTGSGTISYTVTKEVQIGSNMYQNVKDNTKYYGLNSQASSDYYSGETVIGVSSSAWAGRAMYFNKYYETNPISADNTSMQLRINDYPLVIIDNNELKTGDMITLDWSNGGIVLTNSYTETIFPNICLGTLSVDGITFTPKLYLFLYYAYPNNDKCMMDVHTPMNVTKDGNQLKARANWDAYSTGSFQTENNVNWKYGDGISHLKFTHSSTTDLSYIEVYQLVNGEEVSMFSVKLPKEISEYDINCIIPYTQCKNASSTDTIYDTYPTTTNTTIVNSECISATVSGTVFGINTESRTATITEVVTEESDTAAYRVCDINPNCTSKYIGTVHNAQVEDIDGTYEITNETSDYSGSWCKMDANNFNAPRYQALDTSSEAKFIIGMPSGTRGAGDKHGWDSDNHCYLFGEEVYYNAGQGSRNNQWYLPSSWLFIPKGVGNPYTFYDGYYKTNDERYSSQKVLDVNIERDIDDTSG